MKEYVFALGKNWILSIAELVAYLENRAMRVRVMDHSKNVVVVRVDQEMDDEAVAEMQSSLGGCFKTAEVIAIYEYRLFARAYPVRGSFSKRERAEVLAAPWTDHVWKNIAGKRVSFGISTYPVGENDSIDVVRLTRNLSEAVKQKLLDAGARRASYYLYEEPDRRDPNRPNTALWPQTIAKHNLLHPPNAEVLIGITDSRVYIGRTLSVYDSILQQYRDEARPYVSAEISTSPKMCRILLNLAGAKPGCTVLDPFCGTGTLLMEAALLGMRCIGVEIDGDAARGARSNLKWLGAEMEEVLDFKIIKGDARQLPEIVHDRVDAIATEPHLGPVYVEPPTREQAQQTIRELTKLYNEFLKVAPLVLGDSGRISMTLPVINSEGGQSFRIDITSLLRGTELMVYPLLPKDVLRPVLKKPKALALKPERQTLPERKRGQVVQREVIVLGRG
ncbi:MAG: TRM11 family SAM-dependent methyltransferase [Candidatus Thorarchaeota archaeon]